MNHTYYLFALSVGLVSALVAISIWAPRALWTTVGALVLAYLWLRIAGAEEPRSYVLPWNQKLAEQLYGAQREAESRGTKVHVKRPCRSTAI